VKLSRGLAVFGVAASMATGCGGGVRALAEPEGPVSAELAVPAVLATGDAATLERLHQGLHALLGREVRLGPGDPTQSSVLSVLPPPPDPYQDRNPARPEHVRLLLRGSMCVLVRSDPPAEVRLEGVACRPEQPR